MRFPQIPSAAYVTLAVLSALATGELKADWSDYKPASLATAYSEAHIISGTDYTIEPLSPKYLVEVTYTGEHRDIEPERLKLIRGWGKAIGQPDIAAKFEHEIQVQAQGMTAWVPLQDALLEPFARETRTGYRLQLYIMYIGAVKDDRVFVVNEFHVLPK